MKATDKELFAERIIQQVKNSWTAQNKLISDFFSKYKEHEYFEQITPGRNRATYIFGHLISASDGIAPMFGIGERMFPELEGLYTTDPDTINRTYLPLLTLHEKWEAINLKLQSEFNAMTAEDWMSRHTKVSEEDFAKDPLRNKLNVLIGRTTHMNYHLGQLNISDLKKRN